MRYLPTSRFRIACILSGAIPVLLIGGALISEYVAGLYPCEMCLWQRKPHYVAIAIFLLSFLLKNQSRYLAVFAGGLAIFISGMIGGYHAGMEYGWWQGWTACSVIGAEGAMATFEQILNTPLVRCDQAPWHLFGISLAGYNFLISTAAGLFIMINAFLALRSPSASAEA